MLFGITIPHLHLLLNHVPTVGTVVGVGLLLLALVRRNDHLVHSSLEVLFAVAIMTLPVYLTGVAAEEAIQDLGGVRREAISTHESAALLAFIWIVTRAFMIGRRAASLERHFSALVAQGVGLWIGVQAIINAGVNTGMLPTKGLTLPLVSFGGSALLATCCALAVLLRVDWENRQLMRGYTV